MQCIICQKTLKGQQKKYCSRKCHNTNGNTKHQNYLTQKKRGLQRKITLIKMYGGACCICGYQRNLAALEFHHIQPHLKGQNLDIRKLSNSTWQFCLEEAKKCQLLCSNCHAETHHPDLQNGGPCWI